MNRFDRVFRAWPLLALAFVGVLLGGCETLPEVEVGDEPPLQYMTQARVGDKLTIQFTEPGLSSPWEQTIGENGHISLPLGQSVEAEGKTKAELEKAIHDVYVPELYRRLSVNVKLEDRYYWVKGEVRNPNQLKYISSVTILKAIAAAGDYTDFADRGHVRLVRNGEAVRVNNNNFDMPVYPGDTIIVERRF